MAGSDADLFEAEASKKDAIVDRLREDIVSGTLAPGEKLSEARLADRFGVSRMPVREAFKELEGFGFVSIERRRGTFVKSLSRHEILDLYEVREAVEGMAARLCANRANNELMAQIDDAFQLMERCVQSADPEGYSSSDAHFHELIMEGAGNSRLTDHYQLLMQHLSRGLFSLIVSRREGRMQRSLDEHWAIVQALRAHNPSAAEAAMQAHVQRGRVELEQEVTAKFGR